MWKVTKQREYESGRYDIVIRAQDYPGRRIRLTVEEEISKCCEKWRGTLYAVSQADGPTERWLVLKSDHNMLLGPFNFCPECGRKLEGNK